MASAADVLVIREANEGVKAIAEGALQRPITRQFGLHLGAAEAFARANGTGTGVPGRSTSLIHNPDVPESLLLVVGGTSAMSTLLASNGPFLELVERARRSSENVAGL